MIVRAFITAGLVAMCMIVLVSDRIMPDMLAPYAIPLRVMIVFAILTVANKVAGAISP